METKKETVASRRGKKDIVLEGEVFTGDREVDAFLAKKIPELRRARKEAGHIALPVSDGRIRKQKKEPELHGLPLLSEEELDKLPAFHRQLVDDLEEKTRLHQLAKQLGLGTREVTEIFILQGIKRTAMSNLTKEEARFIIEQVSGVGPKPQPSVPVEILNDPDAKQGPVNAALLKRVESNVANEIHQIEEKVERQLSGHRADAKLRQQVESNVANEIHQIEQKVQQDLEQRERVQKRFVPTEHDVTEPENLADSYMPLFMPPTPKNPSAVVEAPVEEVFEEDASQKRRRGRRGTSRGRGVTEVEVEESTEPKGIKGSTRLEAQRRRRVEMREEAKTRRHIVSEAEFLARRESVTRKMIVRERDREDHPGTVTQVGVLEDDMLVEHFVTSDAQSSLVGNVYLGRVQNVLPSMEAAFIDIGKGRNAVLYAGEVNWYEHGLGGHKRRIEQAFQSGDQILVQVSKDPVGHKGARLSTQISLAGRYLVYVPNGRSAGISRKLPANERKRLKDILKRVVPENGGVIIRTAAEGVSEEQIAADVARLHALWEQILERADKELAAPSPKPVTLYEEPNMLVKVVRDLFNEDFSELVVDGKKAWNVVNAYVTSVAPDLAPRLTRFNRDEHEGKDAFEVYRVDEQLKKALSRKVWLPSGGTLVIDRTEAMTVIDVNTGKFTGMGGDLEETVTKNNLEAAEEIVRQMRLRDLGGMIVVDFIDMVLPDNQELVLRRLKETLGRDRTRHQISEVTSLGLVQMTRRRLGTGLLETFATECEHCEGRGVIIHSDPIEPDEDKYGPRKHRDHGVRHQDPRRHPAAVAMHDDDELERSAQESKAKRDRLEELVANVVIENDEQEAPARPKRRSTRRNKSRELDHDEFHDMIDAAVAHADEQDPEEPSGADYEKPRTYEEAVAEYEASPRRRRATRGNSVSDVPPKPEDFPGEQPRPVRGRRRVATKTKPEVETITADEPREEIEVVTRETRSGRTRRRAVRTSRRQAETPQPAGTTRETTPVEEPQPQRTEGEGTRRRRRAVRKVTTAQQEPAPRQEETPVRRSASARRRARSRKR